MKNQKSNPIWNDLSKNLSVIKEGLSNSNFSNEALDRISLDVDRLELEGCKTKIDFEISILKRKNAELTSMEVFVKVLSLLPKKLSSELIKTLTDYILISGEIFKEEWPHRFSST